MFNFDYCEVEFYLGLCGASAQVVANHLSKYISCALEESALLKATILYVLKCFHCSSKLTHLYEGIYDGQRCLFRTLSLQDGS